MLGAHQGMNLSHIHRQMKAVCSFVQPEYQSIFHKIIKILELQMILQELSQEEPKYFHASGLSQQDQISACCDLASFIQAISPYCTENERVFLHQLQNTERALQMMEQFQHLQKFSQNTNEEDFMMQFMTPEQQKAFRRFDTYYSNSN